MTIDTSKEAVERLASRLAGTPLYEGSGEDSELGEYGAETITALAAERDAQTARADAAEAREQALMSTYDAERKVMAENAAMRHDIARLTKSLSDEVTARAAAEAEVAQLQDEIERLRDAVTMTLRADNLREVYHAMPNDHNRIGDKRSRKSHARDAWLRAFRKAAKLSRTALQRKVGE